MFLFYEVPVLVSSSFSHSLTTMVSVPTYHIRFRYSELFQSHCISQVAEPCRWDNYPIIASGEVLGDVKNYTTTVKLVTADCNNNQFASLWVPRTVSNEPMFHLLGFKQVQPVRLWLPHTEVDG